MTAPDERPRLARRIRELLLHELGEDIDLALLLGQPAYARAVVSLCRGSGRAQLVALAAEFGRVSAAQDMPLTPPPGPARARSHATGLR